MAAHGTALVLSLAAMRTRQERRIVPRLLLARLHDVHARKAVETVARAKAESHDESLRRFDAARNVWAAAATALVVGTVLTVWTRTAGW